MNPLLSFQRESFVKIIWETKTIFLVTDTIFQTAPLLPSKAQEQNNSSNLKTVIYSIEIPKLSRPQRSDSLVPGLSAVWPGTSA